jgi:hypothetical protein
MGYETHPRPLGVAADVDDAEDSGEDEGEASGNEEEDELDEEITVSKKLVTTFRGAVLQ